MTNRLVLLSILMLVLLGAAVGGGAFLGRSLNAAPQTKPNAQGVEGRFPLDFQGILLDGEGNAVSNSGHDLTFAIYDRESGSGGQLWSEEQTVFTLDGLFTAELGTDEELDPNIFSNNRETFLGIRVGNDPELTPRIRLAYAPYAMHALSADNVITPPLNFQRIALQRWYEANQADITVPVDDMPGQMLFDGDSIWVTTKGDDDEVDDDNVTKIRPTDGSKLIELEMPEDPSDMVFDGRNVWVSIRSTDELVRFRPDGSRKTTRLPLGDPLIFPELDRPTKMVFDGKHIWVVNQGSNSLSKVRAEDAQRVRITDSMPDLGFGGSITDLAFDGEHVWVAHTGNRNISLIKALEQPADDDDEDFIREFVFGDGEDALAFDGNNMWIVERGNNAVTKVRVSDLEEIDTFDVGNTPTNIAFDGRAIWVVNQDGNNVTKLRASDGKVLGNFFVGEQPVGIVFDGANMWVSNRESNTVVMK